VTKNFCDRCNKECKTLHKVKIPDRESPVKYRDSSFCVKIVELCDSCKSEADNLYNKLTDIRFILFDDFMKGGEGDENN